MDIRAVSTTQVTTSFAGKNDFKRVFMVFTAIGTSRHPEKGKSKFLITYGSSTANDRLVCILIEYSSLKI